MDNRSIEVHILIVDMRYHRAEDTPQTFTRFIGEACDSSHARMGKKHCKKKLVKKKKKKSGLEKRRMPFNLLSGFPTHCLTF